MKIENINGGAPQADVGEKKMKKYRVHVYDHRDCIYFEHWVPLLYLLNQTVSFLVVLIEGKETAINFNNIMEIEELSEG